MVVRDYLKGLPDTPGVYRMLDAAGNALYVGKAKNLKKRVAAYTTPERQSIRIRRMIALTASMEFISTNTEAEALLLEANLIKQLAPRYNILLKDDKSFPNILLTSDHPYPQVIKHRGAQNQKGAYFGPYASAWAVNQTIATLQRAFLLRSCTDSVFASRSRPCLLYQIKRCSAPCVDRIDEAGYGLLVEQARAFLTGHSRDIQQELARQMEKASDALAFEEAALLRDRIRAMTQVQARQDIHIRGISDADIIAAHQSAGHTCIQVFFFRGGGNNGNRAYYPTHGKEAALEDVLEAFIGQFYTQRPPPRTVLLSHRIPGLDVLRQALAVRAGHVVQLSVPARGDKRKIVENAQANAREALGRRLAENASQRRLLEGLAEALGLDGAPERIEIYDNSHVQGEYAVGGMVVAGPEGFVKNAYRKFNIRMTGTDAPITPGDDYGMAREVLTRRFTRAIKENPDRDPEKGGAARWPDLVIFDGGLGQLNVALSVFSELGIDGVTVAAIAKGPDRNAGREKIFLPGRPPIVLDSRDPVLYFLQRLRDEAHRYAIGTHRAKRSKAIGQSILDEIPGIGAKRKKSLLHHFGSARAVSTAGLDDLEAAENISAAIARKIYDHFHPDG
ncbi:MAG: excinuclease ABC subunit UvrC [Rhodospirillales bacterium]|nr:excinuclease ABC subunit UvrC [Rhodospirillales bacterium]